MRSAMIDMERSRLDEESFDIAPPNRRRSPDRRPSPQRSSATRKEHGRSSPQRRDVSPNSAQHKEYVAENNRVVHPRFLASPSRVREVRKCPKPDCSACVWRDRPLEQEAHTAISTQSYSSCLGSAAVVEVNYGIKRERVERGTVTPKATPQSEYFGGALGAVSRSGTPIAPNVVHLMPTPQACVTLAGPQRQSAAHCAQPVSWCPPVQPSSPPTPPRVVQAPSSPGTGFGWPNVPADQKVLEAESPRSVQVGCTNQATGQSGSWLPPRIDTGEAQGLGVAADPWGFGKGGSEGVVRTAAPTSKDPPLSVIPPATWGGQLHREVSSAALRPNSPSATPIAGAAVPSYSPPLHQGAAVDPAPSQQIQFQGAPASVKVQQGSFTSQPGGRQGCSTLAARPVGAVAQGAGIAPGAAVARMPAPTSQWTGQLVQQGMQAAEWPSRANRSPVPGGAVQQHPSGGVTPVASTCRWAPMAGNP